jgi:molybdate transport system substrate-binding protein
MNRMTAVLAVLATLGACSSPPPSASVRHKPALVVSVAASAAESIEEIGRRFTAETGVELHANAGPSNALASQILAGAPADLFLSASPEWADKLAEEGLSAARVDLLTNRLVVVVPRGNPAGVHQPEDLASPAVKKLALADENAPAGKYAIEALGKLGLLDELQDQRKIVRGHDVRAAMSFVERGEAEAGVVYATDAAAVPGVELACEFDPALHGKIVYVLVLVKQEPPRPDARRLFEYLQSDEAASEFAKRKFVPLTQQASQ